MIKVLLIFTLTPIPLLAASPVLGSNFTETHPQMDLKSSTFFVRNRTIERLENGEIKIPKVFTQLVFECKSTLPTRWHFEGRIHDTSLKTIYVRKFRHQKNQYEFRSTIHMEFRTTESLQNLTCQNVCSEELKSINKSCQFLWTGMQVKNRKRFQAINVTSYQQDDSTQNEVDNNRSTSTLSELDAFVFIKFIQGAGKQTHADLMGWGKLGSHPKCSFSLHVDLQTSKFSCRHNGAVNSHHEVSANYVPCGNLDECQMFYAKEPQENCEERNATTQFEENCTGPNCYPLQTTVSSPFILACGEGNSHSVARNFFPLTLDITHSAAETDRVNQKQCNCTGTALTFFSENEEEFIKRFKTEHVLALYNLSSTSSLYSGDTVEFQCTGLKSVLTHGFRWFKLYKNGSTKYLGSSSDEELENGDAIQSHGDSINSKMKISFETDQVEKVRCDASWWNSFKWAQSTYLVNVTESKKPTFELNSAADSKTCSTETLVRSSALEACSCEEAAEGSEDFVCPRTGLPAADITWNVDGIPCSADVRTSKESYVSSSWCNITNSATHSFLRLPRSQNRDVNVRRVQCSARNRRSPSNIVCHEFQIIQEDSRFPIWGIGGISGGFLVLLSLIIATLIRFIHKISSLKAKLRNLTDAEVDEFTNGNPKGFGSSGENGNISFSVLPFNPNYIIQPSDLTIDTNAVLGKGQYGMVHRGLLHGRAVAVKTILPHADVLYMKSFLNELKIMGSIGSHENIVEFVGAVTKHIQRRDVKAVLEFSSMGSLYSYLRNIRKGSGPCEFVNLLPDHSSPASASTSTVPLPLVPRSDCHCDKEKTVVTTIDMMKWCKQIAAGMEFLTSKKVIHGDLAARNVLLFPGNVVKVCDFGLSRQLYAYATYVQKPDAPLPWNWMSLESLRFLEFSLESDVWSFGVTMWEIFSMGQVPYPGVLNWTHEFVDILANGMRMAKPKLSPKIVYDAMLNCWNEIPQERPSFTALVAFFDRILNQVNVNTNSLGPLLNGTYDTIFNELEVTHAQTQKDAIYRSSVVFVELKCSGLGQKTTAGRQQVKRPSRKKSQNTLAY